METVSMLLWYWLAISIGAMGSELWYFVDHQEKEFNHGMKFREQIGKWFDKRWDDMALAWVFGAIAAFLLHTVDVGHILQWLIQKVYSDFGMELKITSYAGACLVALFNYKIRKKLKGKKNEVE